VAGQQLGQKPTSGTQIFVVVVDCESRPIAAGSKKERLFLHKDEIS